MASITTTIDDISLARREATHGAQHPEGALGYWGATFPNCVVALTANGNDADGATISLDRDRNVWRARLTHAATVRLGRDRRDRAIGEFATLPEAHAAAFRALGGAD